MKHPFEKINKGFLPNTDFEVRSLDEPTNDTVRDKKSAGFYIKYLLLGVLFGVILVKSEAIAWFRIQEMFRFQSFHMFGLIGSAVVTGMISVWFIKRFSIRTASGEPVRLYKKQFSKGTIWGGLVFGMGWAITGACPGPLFAQVGQGATVVIITLLSAVGGTWVYGLLRERLPH